MSDSTATQNAPAELVTLSRLLWVAPAAMALAAVANAAIYLAADAMFGVAGELAFNLVTVFVGTLAYLLVGALVFAEWCALRDDRSGSFATSPRWRCRYLSYSRSAHC